MDAILDQVELLSATEVQMKYKSVDTSRSLTTTYTADTHLTGFTVAANGVYVVELNMSTTIGAGNLNTRFTFPSGTGEAFTFDWNNASVTYANAWQKVASSSSPLVAGGFTTGGPIRIMFTLFVGASAGTLSWEWAQSSSNAANTTVHKGSWCRVTRLA